MKSVTFAFTFLLLLLVSGALSATERRRPNPDKGPRFARWLIGEAKWGFIATLRATAPSGYIASYSDVDGAGVPFFYFSTYDQAGRNILGDDRACLTVTELAVDTCRGADPQSPFCPKVSLTGRLRLLPDSSWEAMRAEAALFSDHPQLARFPKYNGSFAVYKLELKEIVLVSRPAAATVVPVAEYLGAY